MGSRPFGTTITAWGLLVALASTAPGTAHIHPAEAVDHIGRDVELAGIVIDARAWPDGRARTVIAQDGAAVVVHHDGTAPARGAWVEARGTLRGASGEVRLEATDLLVTAPPEVPETPLAVVAADPEAWAATALAVRGVATPGQLRDGPVSIATGDGPWIQGNVVAVGAVAYDATCLCHRLHAAAVRPWT